jgi:hypothetical protein
MKHSNCDIEDLWSGIAFALPDTRPPDSPVPAGGAAAFRELLVQALERRI